MEKKIVITCQVCGKSVKRYRQYANQKFCSRACLLTYRNSIPKIMLVCKFCGQQFPVTPSGTGKKFCCKACKDRATTGVKRHNKNWIEKTCLSCGKSFSVRPYRSETALYCSLVCKHIGHSVKTSGGGNPSWKGGISFEPYPKTWNRKFKNAIRERDNYTCAICNKQGNEVHHIDYNKSNMDENNLITLCRHCHRKTNHHRSYWISYFSN